MATCGKSVSENIPDYEYIDVNTKTFDIGAFRDLWLERLKPSHYSYKEQEDEEFETELSKEFGLNAETVNDLKSICSLDSLRCNPVDWPTDTNVVPPDSTLRTLIQRKRRQDYKSNLTVQKVGRHDLYADELERLTFGRNPTEGNEIPEGEVIISVNVYYPTIFERFKYIRPHMTLLMTGSHTLANLRDAICCVSDLQVCGEFSNTPDIAPDFISKDHYRSSFFYLEGVFYNDMRFPECQDISSTTIEWAKSHNFPSYEKAKMEDTKFIDLKIKVGFPYLYCHQGDCEHLVIITDVRLSHKTDCLDKKLYPLLTHKHRVTTRRCLVCHLYIGRWLTSNDQYAPCDPCLFCDKCFRLLHYDDQGNKLGDFLAYPYVDPGAFN
ncbi:snRNA-activating protein complex subunit 3 [Gadus macrocephalus]|uniref:snRNA-activating protein complex subunit 3 n=1 Tax=Gadus macrocephalus TaxID=80720 RepID=UPI0028CB5BAB|nr:snRNA-activating protein complex subunit 3 [Gadus macrocephalus]